MTIQNILIIRFRRIGDSVLAMALCHSLRKSFPDAQIHFVLNKGIAPLYKEHPDIDRIITFDEEENKKPLKYLEKVRHIMKETHYDVIIDMRSTVRTLLFSLFSLSTPYRIGSRKGYNRFLHNYRIDNHGDDSIDMVKQNLMLMNPLEKEKKLFYSETFRLYVTENEKKAFRVYMEEQGICFGRPVILATVTARLVHKVWDKYKMKEVLSRIIRYYDAQIIFNFAGNEETAARRLHEEMNHDEHIFTNIHAGGLRELCALAANCNFFFGNEGGPRHIAHALDIPSYAIYPPGIWKGVWLPGNGQRHQGISPDDKVPLSLQEKKKLSYQQRFDLVSVESVWKELDDMLKEYL